MIDSRAAALPPSLPPGLAVAHDASALEAGSVPEKIRSGLRLLLQAFEYAGQLGRNPWDFAVEIASLRLAGLNESDFRWLVCKGFVTHACETGIFASDDRVFRPEAPLRFTKRSCFVLTLAGAAAACLAGCDVEEARPAITPAVHGHAACDAKDVVTVRPAWDRNRHKLHLGNRLVKEFRLRAQNQGTVLTAFEEEGWPARIDDPLQPSPDIDSKRRLADTIKRLNRNQTNRLILFRGDGTGEGVIWELC
jgi:hypothetical protein